MSEVEAAAAGVRRVRWLRPLFGLKSSPPREPVAPLLQSAQAQ
jgi:hypothetical protein